MAIFRRDSPSERPEPEVRENRKASAPAPGRPRPAERSGGQVTLIANGTRIEGRLTGKAEVVVEGEVEGEVALDGHLQIGTEGRVRGNLDVRSARIAGRLIGNVRGKEVVELTATGKLEGDMAAPRVKVAEGAFFRGNIEMGEEKKPSPPKASPSGASGTPASPQGSTEPGP
jgi:cytoskeletal protein CcmA (bactofilin family)